MQPRRSLRLMAGALVLALPLLGSCGFGKATDRVYTPGEGVNNRDGDVDVLSAVIVAAQPNSGTFVASMSNNLVDDDATLDSVAAGDDEGLTFSEIASGIEIPARGFVNLVNEEPITVTGEFEAGQFVDVTLTFASGDTVDMNIAVVFACDEYTDLDRSATDAEADAEPTEGATDEPTDEAGAPEPGEPYDCASVLEEH